MWTATSITTTGWTGGLPLGVTEGLSDSTTSHTRKMKLSTQNILRLPVNRILRLVRSKAQRELNALPSVTCLSRFCLTE